MTAAGPDVFVAGAGPAGLTIARLLALKARRVFVASDDRPPNRRLELLTPAAFHTVEALGLEPLLRDKWVARRCLGIRRLQERDRYEDFLRHPAREGFVVDRERFDARLREAALAAGAQVLPMRVLGADDEGLSVRTPSGALGRWPFDGVVVDATGRASAIARRRGAEIVYRERRVAELVEEAKQKSDEPSWLDFENGEIGWSYCVCGPGGRSQTWRVHRAGRRIPDPGKRVDASARLLSHAAGERWIAIGDAATAFEPIASQGLFNALSTALFAAGLLQSGEGLTRATASAWTAVVTATFLHSEVGRRANALSI